MTDVAYPPQPWDLRGVQYVSTFLVPASTLSVTPPPGWRPVRVFGRLVVGAAWVSYQPPGVLSYSEIMSTVLVRRGLRVTPHITDIWVDSEASLAGGRALWAIPKELASFAVDGDTWRADEADGRSVALADLRATRTIPGRVRLRFSVAQSRDGAAVVSPVRVSGRLSLARARWSASPTGRLGFLAGQRPVVSFALRGFRMSFGRADH